MKLWIINEHIKRCSISLVARELQIKITMRYQSISIRMDIRIKFISFVEPMGKKKPRKPKS
jgi:hypothetical protein